MMSKSKPPNDFLSPKQPVQAVDAPQRISEIKFCMFSQSEMARVSEMNVWNQELYHMPARTPALSGVLDPHLGVSDKIQLCKTCGKKVTECAGHFGHVDFQLPVFHIGFFKQTLVICQCVCKFCSSILLTDEQRQSFLSKTRKPHLDALQRGAIFKKVVEQCKKTSVCPRCGMVNGTVKKVSGVHTLKLVHDRFKGKVSENDFATFKNAMTKAVRFNPEIAQHIHKAIHDLSPMEVLNIFRNISDEDCELLWMDPTEGRPEKMLMETVLVPPVPIRPSVAMDTGAGSNEDDLTVKMQEIIGVNNALRDAVTRGATVKMLVEDWNFLQVQVAQYMNGEMPGLAKPIGEKQPIRGLCQRLKGKSGRFRGNLSGKRVDFSARTVISPDPNLSIDQVGVPVRVAMTMTFPERVSRHNLSFLRTLVVNGPNQHPGANYIRTGTLSKSLAYGNRSEIAAKLQIGDIVERHMIDGDVVLFNRQPSLHKLSIMSHRVKVLPWRTFRFNECVCAPYNADFDGDEMNMHLPQTHEARAEAAHLMCVSNNLVTPRNGEPLVAATQDFLTAAYLITQKNVFFDRQTLCNLVSSLGDGLEKIDLPMPAILKPVQLWTGKQIFSLLVRPNKAMKIIVNFELEEKNYTGTGGPFCQKDGLVLFRNSEHLSGNIAKKTLGDGSKKGLFYVLMREHGPQEAGRCMNRIAKLCAAYMGQRGFSIGIADVTPSNNVVNEKEKLLGQGYKTTDDLIDLFEKGQLELKPGCDASQSLESDLTGVLNKIRETAGKMAMRELPWANAPRIMAECGSKGSVINISQMIACLGQQAVDGKRIQNGFVQRTLPHFQTASLFPSAKGFVANSFYSGLTATEFFFHTMGGREGLVDTAVKTAQTGYMARRLMKALEDLSLHYDSTVRNSENTVVQFQYGSDGLCPWKMETNDRPLDLPRLYNHVLASTHQPRAVAKRCLSSSGIKELADSKFKEKLFVEARESASLFLKELTEFLDKLVHELERLQTSFGVDGTSSKYYEPTLDYSWSAVHSIAGVREDQLNKFLDLAMQKYITSKVEPGEAIGALGAQSLSEPGTQMTLKTFHFAGVASMNVTLGVPRLTEIINASRSISTPIITAQLVQDNNEYAARVVKGRIEKTTLGEVCDSILEVFSPDSCHLLITIDMDLVRKLQLEISAASIRKCILKGVVAGTRPAVLRALDEKLVQLTAAQPNQIRVLPPTLKAKSGGGTVETYFTMQALKRALLSVIVEGIPTVNRAVISAKESGNGYNLLVEGCGLSEVMGAPGINGTQTETNHILEVMDVLGIEAARSKISDEITYIMSAYGIHIDQRHLVLLSDVMTFKGEVLGITRFGLAKMRESVLMLASFEKTTDHLFDAAVHSRRDHIVGVSECIIMGVPIPLGTGLFKILRSPSDQADIPVTTSRSKRTLARAQDLREEIFLL